MNIYAIQDGAGFVKIGISERHPSGRMSDMQTGNAQTLSLVGFGSHESALHLERQLHRDLKRAGVHVRGEWFTPSILTTCVANAVSVGYLEEAGCIAYEAAQ